MMNLTQLETPRLVLDKDKVQRNISAMHQKMECLGVTLRPHGKTAKNIEVVNLAIAGQAGGITVSTLKEAEYYFNHGISDIVYAVGIAPVKLERVAKLTKEGARITLLLDSVEQVGFVGQKAQEHELTIPVLIELDCDGHRSGVTPGDPLLLEIGRQVTECTGTSLAGVLTHAGDSYACKSQGAIRELARVEVDAAVSCAQALRKAGMPSPIVSVGSTPTVKFAQDLSGVTEVRAGVFMFYDLVMAGLGVCQIEDIAVSVLASVIGHQKKKGWIIVDAGWMALSRDRGTASQFVDQGYGLVCDVAGKVIGDLVVSETNQEHGIVSSRSGEPIDWQRYPIGATLRVLPNHACATAAMHDHYVVIDERADAVAQWPRYNGW